MRGVYVYENGCGTFERDHFGSGEEGEIGHEDGIALADAKGFEGKGEGIGAVGTGKAVLDAHIFGQLLFEFFDRCTHDKMGRGGHVGHGFVYIGFSVLDTAS